MLIVYKKENKVHNYHLQMKLLKGNVFTSMCQEFCPQGEVYLPWQTPPWPDTTPPWQTPQADSMHPTGMHSCYILLFHLDANIV